MSSGTHRKIVRLLGVGFDTEDGHVRITKGDGFDVLMGSEESHEYITELIGKIEVELDRRGISLSDVPPEQLSEIVESIR